MRKFSNVLNRLPNAFNSDKDAKIIVKFLENSSVFYSSLFLVTDEGKFLIKKS